MQATGVSSPARGGVEVWEKGLRKESAAALAGELRKEPRKWSGEQEGRRLRKRIQTSGPRGLKNRVP